MSDAPTTDQAPSAPIRLWQIDFSHAEGRLTLYVANETEPNREEIIALAKLKFANPALLNSPMASVTELHFLKLAALVARGAQLAALAPAE